MARSRPSVGVFTTDRSLVVQTWDPWLADATGIPESVACGEPLARLYPELAERGLLARLRRVAEGAGVDILAPALHKYFIPCPPRDRTSGLEHMRQHVTLAPLRNYDGVAGVVVTIRDVTPRFDRARRLAADLDSADESVRLRAVTELSRDGQAPTLLSGALSDDSWRVRRAAVEGMATGGGQEVVDTLVEALREHHRNPALLNAAITALVRTTEDGVVAIVPLLQADDADVRTYAALALGLMDDARAVPPLIERIGDGDTNVRFHAIEALGRLGDRRAADAIAAVAVTGDFFLGFAALDALAAIGDASVAMSLVPLLDDGLLMAATANCLGAIGTEEVVVSLTARALEPGVSVAPIALALARISQRVDDPDGEGSLVGALVRTTMAGHSGCRLIDALADADAEERRALAVVISWLDDDGVDAALASLLTDDDTRDIAAERLAYRGVGAAPYIEALTRGDNGQARRAGAIALGRIGSPVSVPALIAMTSDVESDVVIAAVGGLGAIGDRLAFEPLLALMDHPEATVRQATVAALNSIGHPGMEAKVAARLHHDSPRVRESAARVAGYFGYDSCLRRMVDLCEDAEPLVRRTVVESLANYDQRAAWSKIQETTASDPDATVRAAGVRALAQARSGDVIDTLIRAFGDRGPWVRYYAARTAARLGALHADVLTALAECAMRDHATPVRIAAVEALGILGATSMVDVLITLARDTDLDVSCAAIASLGAFSSEEASDAIATALRHEHPRRQVAALEAIGQQGAAAAGMVDVVVGVARHTRDEELRRSAIRALGRIGDAAAIGALTSLIAEHRFTDLAISALSELTEEQFPPLAQDLLAASDIARELIAGAISRMTHASAGPVLARMLDDPAPRVRRAAARGLAALDLSELRARPAPQGGDRGRRPIPSPAS